jgi:hypothetical protein
MSRVGIFQSIVLVALSVGTFAVRAAGADGYLPPPGGWNYSYEANAGQDSAGTAPANYDSLDGTFGYGNGSDTWDGTKIGDGSTAGGVVVVGGSYLRLQDPGDPRDYGAIDPSSRKIYLAHKTAANGATPNQLDEGVTLHFRMRLATGAPIDDLMPDGGGAQAPWPAAGDGYEIHDNGKGMIGFHQTAGGLVSFSLINAGEAAEVTQSGLITNHLNGTVASDNVDVAEAGTPNALPLDPAKWHEFWVTIEAGGAGTHLVTVYLDGAVDPAATFDVTAGTGDDIGEGYLSLGEGSTRQAGAFDVDYVRFAAGVISPVASSQSVPAVSGSGMAALMLLVLTLGAVLLLRKRPALEN